MAGKLAWFDFDVGLFEDSPHGRGCRSMIGPKSPWAIELLKRGTTG